MATYTEINGTLVCIGNNITSSDILSNLNSLNLGSGHFGESGSGKNVYYFNYPIQIGDDISSGNSSIWNCSKEHVKISTSRFTIFGTVQQGSFSNGISANGGSFTVIMSNDNFRLDSNGIFRAYGSAVYASGRIALYEDTEFTVLDCDFEPEDAIQPYGRRCVINLDRTRVHHTGAVGVKLFSLFDGEDAAVFSLANTRIEACNYAFQIGNSGNFSPILKDVKINSCNSHHIANIDDADITFINPDFTILRAIAEDTDISRVLFRYSAVLLDTNSNAIVGAKCRYVDENGDIVLNNTLTDSNGNVTGLTIYDGTETLANGTFAGVTRTVRAVHTKSFMGYNHLVKSESLNVNKDIIENIILPIDNLITETTKSTVDTYTELENAKKFYDRAKSYLVDNYLGEDKTIVTKSGIEIDAGAYNIDIDADASEAFAFDGTTITIHADNFTGDLLTTGIITLSNGANVIGTYQDANGTVAPADIRFVAISNLVANSRVRIFNVTSSTELLNEVITGTSYSDNYIEGIDYDEDDVVNIRITNNAGVTSKNPLSANVVAGASGWSVLAEQTNQTLYNTFGVDGSTINEFDWDSGNVEIDINDTDNETNIQRLAAWYYYFVDTSVGIAEAFGAITWENLNSIRINSERADVTLDNVRTQALMLKGGRLYRDDGLTIIAASSNSIQIDYDPVYTIETGVSGLTASESQRLSETSTVTVSEIRAAFDPDDFKANISTLATIDLLNNISVALVAEHNTTQQAISNSTVDLSSVTDAIAALNNFDPASDTVEARNMRGTDNVTVDLSSVTDAIAALNNFDPANDTVNARNMRGTDNVNLDLTPVTDAIAALNNFDPANDTVNARNMRGTDGANTTTPNNALISSINVTLNALSNNQGNWLTATGFSTHSAADVTAAMQAIADEFKSDIRTDLSDEITYITELHTARGLRLGRAVTFTPVSISASGLSMTITGDGVETSTVTRNA